MVFNIWDMLLINTGAGATNDLQRGVFGITNALIHFVLDYFFLFLDDEGNGQSESEERLPDLPLLSEQLLLDELWDMLGECLKELEESHDQHAVLGRWNPSAKMPFL